MKFYIFAVVFVISAILATGGNANADIVPAGQRAADLDILQTIGGWANQAKDAIADLGRADMDPEDHNGCGMLRCGPPSK